MWCVVVIVVLESVAGELHSFHIKITESDLLVHEEGFAKHIAHSEANFHFF